MAEIGLTPGLGGSNSGGSTSLFGVHPHYEACRILEAAGVHFCVWAEDALRAYGVPTVTFDLHLIVETAATASKPLIEKGYIPKPLEKDIMPIPEFSKRYGPPGSEDQRDVVLLVASEWSYDLRDTMTTGIPPLVKLLDSLMCKWTDQGSRNLRFHLAVLISYCFQYITIVKELDFASELNKENRQLYFDLVDGPAVGGLATYICHEHYRAVRGRIRSGELDPVGQSDICLFPNNAFFPKDC